jgi:hypothetical protein
LLAAMLVLARVVQKGFKRAVQRPLPSIGVTSNAATS